MKVVQGSVAADNPSPAEVLYRRAAPIRAVVEGELNVFARACQALEHVAETLGAPIAIVGGMAGIHHGAAVTTLDIDIAISKDQLNAVLAAAESQGLTIERRDPEGWHRLRFQDSGGYVEIHVIPEGAKNPKDPPHAPPNPSPQSLGVQGGLGYASFGGWCAMKLVANRRKDQYHLVEALKHASEAYVAEAVVALRDMHPSYLRNFRDLLREAEDER